MTSKLVLDNLAGRTTAGSIAVVAEGNGTTTNLQGGLAKVWIYLTMSTATNNDSLNVGSVTDSAAGNFLINLSNAFSSTNYNIVSGASYNQTHNTDFGEITQIEAANQYRHVHRENNAAADTQYGSNTSVNGDLA